MNERKQLPRIIGPRFDALGLTTTLLVAFVAGCSRPELPPLARAAREGDVAAIASLLKAGADVDAPSGVNGWTPLLHAIHKRQGGAVKALLAAGAAVDGPRTHAAWARGVTPLMMAAGYGQLEIVEALLAAGADPRVSRGSANALWAASGFGAIADISDGPPLGTCFPDVADALLAKAPDLRLRWRGVEAKLTYWFASKDCKRLIDRLRAR